MIGYCVIVQSLQLLRNSTVIAESNSSLLCSGRFDARTAMWLKIQVFCDVLCRLANSTRPLDGSYCRPVQGPAGLALTLRKNTEDVFSFTNFFFHYSDAPELQFGGNYALCRPWNTRWVIHVRSDVRL